MKRWLQFLWFFVGAVSLTAADYRMKIVKVLPIESYPAQTTVGGVTIALDPYTTDEKSYKAFDYKKMNSRGYFPLHVIIHNSTQDFLLVRTRNITLVTESAQQLYTTPAAAVAEDLFPGAALDKMSDRTRSAPASRRLGTPLADFAEKDLTNKLLEPGNTTSGFLFFFNPDPQRNLFVGSTLFIPRLEEEGTRKTIGPFTIPLNPALSPAKSDPK